MKASTTDLEKGVSSKQKAKSNLKAEQAKAKHTKEKKSPQPPNRAARSDTKTTTKQADNAGRSKAAHGVCAKDAEAAKMSAVGKQHRGSKTPLTPVEDTSSPLVSLLARNQLEHLSPALTMEDSLPSILAVWDRGLPQIRTLLKRRGVGRSDRLALINALSVHRQQS